MKQIRRLVYIAGPLYTPSERAYLEEIETICKESGFDTYLPHRDGGLAPADGSSTLPFFRADIQAMLSCSLVVAVLNGTDVDSGAAWELGYMYAYKRPLIGIFEDTRIDDPLAAMNLMITSSTKVVGSRTLLARELRKFNKEARNLNRPRIGGVSAEDVIVLVSYLKKIPLDFERASPDTFGHETAVLCCLDAVLSINRPYKRFVVPRLDRFRKKFSKIRRLAELNELINQMPIRQFAKQVLNYDHVDRVKVLGRVASRLLRVINCARTAKDELAQLKSWAEVAGVDGYEAMKVNGIGLTTYQYLRMLFGADTVKPDVHILGVVSQALGKRMRERDAIRLIEAAAAQLGVSALSLDHAIWSFKTDDAQLEFGHAL
jgi:nucleoside 2-deoxyribosyltransferase